MESVNPDEFAAIEIGAAGVCTRFGIQWATFIPRDKVLHLALANTFWADWPILAAVSGAVLVLLGLPLSVGLLFFSRVHDREITLVTIFWASVAFVGAWVIKFALTKRPVLVVHATWGPVKLVFRRSARRQDILRFAVDATRRHGYKFVLDPSITRFGKDR